MRIPVKTVTVGAIVSTAAVAAWLLVHVRDDPPRGDRGPVALPNVSAAPSPSAGASDASTPDAVVSDAP